MNPCLVALAMMPFVVAGQQPKIYNYEGGAMALPLWPDGAPGAAGKEKADIPSITRFDPPAGKATGAAIVVCPGGGYGFLASHEGPDTAEWLAQHGLTAFVLKYRLAPRYKHPAMMHDAQRAIRMVRAHAKEWKLDPGKVGIMGYSAGGHLASTATTHFDAGNASATDPVDRVSCRPDFSVLCYPVISFDPAYTHMGSRDNLIGKNPPADLVELLSNEKQVTSQTPPVFMFHTSDDGAVPLEGVLRFALACRKNNVPIEVHTFEHGPHGVGLAAGDPILSEWTHMLAIWLKKRGLAG